MLHNQRMLLLGCLFALAISPLSAQRIYWQQRASYQMAIDFDANTHQYTGTQRLAYTNNSPDTLAKVFYHLYNNAFQPGSMMDVRSRTISDPDGRVRDRISKLQPNEEGHLHVQKLAQDGQAVVFEEVGTILEVTLAKPIMPKQTVTFEMEFKGQAPLQIRRSGRDSKEGISYSISQWYPKMAEYDEDGWSSNPYIGREFHGIWGDFDVKISIDERFIVAGTGVLQNPNEVGSGYEQKKSQVKRAPKDGKLTWHFKAENLHDFVWAADPDYAHRQVQVPNGPLVRLFYQRDPVKTKAWEDIDSAIVTLFQSMNSTYGKYPYPEYSIIQGGDGGMEYPMATLITGERNYESLVGVIVHEVVHSWFQMLLGTNEAKYAWMDEGFTSFASDNITDAIFGLNSVNPQADNYMAYYRLVASGKAEPLTTHSDHYKTNYAYSINSYSKGAVALEQLSYVIGRKAFSEGMKRYFETWKFKHPTPNDLKRVMEKVSGLELDWYFEHWVGTLNTIDYAISDVSGEGDESKILLERIGAMPMPIDLVVAYTDGSRECYHIPMEIMRGAKPAEYDMPTITAEDWPWVYPTYELTIKANLKNISAIYIDPSQRMADVDMSNNAYPPADSKSTRKVKANKKQ